MTRHLLTILTGKSDISKVVVFSQAPKSKYNIFFEVVPLKAKFSRHFVQNTIQDVNYNWQAGFKISVNQNIYLRFQPHFFFIFLGASAALNCTQLLYLSTPLAEKIRKVVFERFPYGVRINLSYPRTFLVSPLMWHIFGNTTGLKCKLILHKNY